MIRALILLATAMTLSACSEPPYQELSASEFQQLLQHGDVPVYDIRRPEEWRQTGVVAGSRLLTFVDAGGRVQPDFLPRFTQEVTPDQPVILICRTGNRTGALARYLTEELGYSQVHHVEAGILDWISQRKPVERI